MDNLHWMVMIDKFSSSGITKFYKIEDYYCLGC